jgi:hypothetical protein
MLLKKEHGTPMRESKPVTSAVPSEGARKEAGEKRLLVLGCRYLLTL